MSQKSHNFILPLGIILSILFLVNFWFVIKINFVWAYIVVVVVLVSLSGFLACLLLKIKLLQDAKNKYIVEASALKEKYFFAKEEKDRVFQVIANFSDGIILLDSKGIIKNINFQAEKILGIASSSLLERSVLELKNFLNAGFIVPLVAQEKETVKKEILIDNSLVIEVSVYPLIIHSLIFDKKDIAKCIVIRDITKEKVIEKRGADFVSLTIHQLNAPLAALKLSLEMLLAGDFGKLSKQQKSILEKMYQRDKMMVSLVSGLLHVAKIEQEGYAYNQTEVNFEELVKLVVDFNEEEIKNKKIRFAFNKPAIQLPGVLIDKEKMFLAIQNIVDNAVKYTPVKGTITLSLALHGNELELKIEDSGIGIPEAQRDKLFSKFFRAANATKMQVGGSGLGLFITKSIVEAHGGKIWCTSKEDHGSTFFILLPIR